MTIAWQSDPPGNLTDVEKKEGPSAMPSMPKIRLFRKRQPEEMEAATYEAYANARSIEAIPWDQLDDLDAKGELLRRALSGQEVYAYRPAYQEQWVVWLREGRMPDQEMRWHPSEWALQWHQEGEPRP